MRSYQDIDRMSGGEYSSRARRYAQASSPSGRVDRGDDIAARRDIGGKAAGDRIEIDHGLAEIGAGHQELMAERRAARRIPGNAVAPQMRRVEVGAPPR